MVKTFPLRLTVVLAFFLLGVACRSPQAVLAPPSAHLREIEGHASLKLTRNGETGRSRFSFVLEPARRGKVEVTDVLGGTLALLVLVDAEAYVVIPSKKIYWKSGPEEVLEKFLGFQLSLNDMAALLSGSWPERLLSGGDPEGWTLDADRVGRMVAGRRPGLEFRVREFFPSGSVPRRMDFRSGLGEGSLILREIDFNKPVDASVFALDFRRTYAARSWDDIQKVLRRED